ncbi:hypothetical protein GCM10015535_05930 [Streptomyces gelaticus]|uniref:Uncharacterized protein n=1 Tax=Streptomyces gelaticus TaxID=285446 RepID=A0ABQ2VTR4_9ACTN|nr:hypothetical protein GCM10015535_05930 [Streptomyces gelaticus]
MQLIRDQLVGETAGEGHEVIGGDGAGDCDSHGETAPAEIGGNGWLCSRGGVTVHATGSPDPP